MPVTQVLVTHADWDHVMALGVLPDAQVTASTGAAERIRSGDARARSSAKESAEVLLAYARDRRGCTSTRWSSRRPTCRSGRGCGVCRAGPGPHRRRHRRRRSPTSTCSWSATTSRRSRSRAAYASVHDYRDDAADADRRDRARAPAVRRRRPRPAAHRASEALRDRRRGPRLRRGACWRSPTRAARPTRPSRSPCPCRAAGAADRVGARGQRRPRLRGGRRVAFRLELGRATCR